MAQPYLTAADAEAGFRQEPERILGVPKDNYWSGYCFASEEIIDTTTEKIDEWVLQNRVFTQKNQNAFSRFPQLAHELGSREAVFRDLLNARNKHRFFRRLPSATKV